MKRVFIVQPNVQYRAMFIEQGWEVVDKLRDADLVQFTGGEDVSPELYNSKPHPTTGSNSRRDIDEAAIWEVALQKDKPMAGICRGGQFLNVMCGGTMWQDVDGHCGSHEAFDVETGQPFKVTSTHHQMMAPNLRVGEIVAYAEESTQKERVDGKGKIFQLKQNTKEVTSLADKDIEAVYYEPWKVFCFQPHPEFTGEQKLAKQYFHYLDKYLGV